MLLQNRKNEGVNLSYLHEAKLQIEAMIELCREGEISVYDAERIISGEWFYAIGFERELTEDIDDLRKTENHRMMDVAIIQDEITHVQEMLGVLAEYIIVLENDKELSEILLSDDYKLKRKTKIKTQGITGYEDKETQIPETTEPLQTAGQQPPEHTYEQNLFNQFPIFEKHSAFLKDNGYYTIDQKNLTWVHGGNLLLAGYFGMIQDVPGNSRFSWTDIEKAFNTKHLAQFYSDYENMRKGKSSKHYEYDKKLRNLIAKIPL